MQESIMQTEVTKETTFIVKSNTLIEARYRLSLQEMHVILWLLTQIKQEDEDFKLHKLDISTFAKMINVKAENQYKELKKITKSLLQRTLEFEVIPNDEILQVSWLSAVRYKYGKGFVLLEFSPQLKPYLLNLKSHFTKIDLVDTLKLRSIYAVRIFELLLQYSNIGSRIIAIELIREFCGIKEKEYQKYSHLKTKVLEKAKSEINDKTEYDIDYSEIKESRKVVSIEWTIKKKKAGSSTASLFTKASKEYRSELVVIDALIDYGFSKPIARRMVQNNGEEVVRNAMKAVDLQIERKNVKNPKAMLRVAIQEQWHPEKFKTKKKVA